MELKKISKSNLIFYGLLVLIDICILYLSIRIAYLLRFDILDKLYRDIDLSVSWRKYYQYFNYFILIYCIILYHFDFYKKEIFITAFRFKKTIMAAATFIIIIFFISFYLQYTMISRIFYLFFFFILIFFNVIRFFLKILLLKIFAMYNLINKNLLFVFIDSPQMQTLIIRYKKHKLFNICGYFDYKQMDNIDIKYLGGPEVFKEYISNIKPESLEIIVGPKKEYKKEIFDIINAALSKSIKISIIQNLKETEEKYIMIDEIESIPLLKIT